MIFLGKKLRKPQTSGYPSSSLDYPRLEYSPIVPNYGEYFFPDVNIRQTIIRQPRQNN